ncbi:HIT domain-containing protein [Buchnera aphidicola]|uniref:HIT domain-containing protein n=1 Tax=Buchnera aphidicola TaxID=9 RepID=UPI00094D37FC|nr:HIT domain-containing protein [Buchnera aphidicola]
MNQDNIFQKIINKKIKSELIYQDQYVTAFKDLFPKAPIHILVVPNILITSLDEINQKNKKILMYMYYAAIKITRMVKINISGYRLIMNCNPDSGQEIQHIHLHILGGQYLGPILSKI